MINTKRTVSASIILSEDYGIDDNGCNLVVYSKKTQAWFDRTMRMRNGILLMGHNTYKQLFSILPEDYMKYVVTNNEITYDAKSFKINISDSLSWLFDHSHMNVHIIGGYYTYMTYWKYINMFYIATVLDKKINSNLYIESDYMQEMESNFEQTFCKESDNLELRIMVRK